MPQMAPMNWLMILMFSILMIMMLNLWNYFSLFYMPKKNNLKSKMKNNWKW